MTPERQHTLDMLAELPDGIWIAYIQAIRGVNLVMGNYVVDDPTPCEDVEMAIRAELGEVSH